MLKLFFLSIVVQSALCDVLDVEYSWRILGDEPNDLLGFSLATSRGKLAVGAPGGRYVMVGMGKGDRVHYHGEDFGKYVAVNQHFLVVRGDKCSVHVYDSNSLDFQAKITTSGRISGIAMSERSTIAIMETEGKAVRVYEYDGYSTWHLQQTLSVEGLCVSLGLSDTTVVIGYDRGCFDVYNNINGKWILQETIKDQSLGFVREGEIGLSGNHMAALSWPGPTHTILSTYEWNKDLKKWVNNNRFDLPSDTLFRFSEMSVSIQGDTMVVPINDNYDHPNVCAFVYKLYEKTSKIDGNGEKSNQTMIAKYNWKKVAHLRTVKDPLTGRAQHVDVSIQGQYVFTGRPNPSDGPRDTGKVFVHDLGKIL